MLSDATKARTGLFLLQLQTVTPDPLMPLLQLRLTVSTPTEAVEGYAEVIQATTPRGPVTSHVTGSLNPQYVMPPGKSHIRLDLTGYPNIQWPSNGGIGPVILPNFKATVLLDTKYSTGHVFYQYCDAQGAWHSVDQTIVQMTWSPIRPLAVFGSLTEPGRAAAATRVLPPWPFAAAEARAQPAFCLKRRSSWMPRSCPRKRACSC